MAQQSYKKFVATAATATLVASALVPVASANVNTAAFTDVSAGYADAVEFVVSNNIASGITATQFGISQQIKRGDAAIMIASAAGLNDETAPAAGFSDVPKRGALAVNSLKAAGVVNGKTTTKFGFEDNITRGEAAIMLQKAFELKAGSTQNSFTDVSSRYDDAVDALVANGVTNGINKTQFGTGNAIKRGDFAKFLYALKDQIEDPAVEVETVTVVNETTTTAKVKSADKNLTAADFKVLVNGTAVTPTKVESDEKGEVYTITHDSLAGKKGIVSVNGKQADFNFEVVDYVVKSVNAVTTTVDNTTRGQKVEFSINDNKTVTVEDLTKQGYKVEFQSNKEVFDTSRGAQSETGVLNARALQDIYEASAKGDREFTYNVTVTKDGESIKSNDQVVSIVDASLGAKSIDAHTISKTGTNPFTLNSSTLVVGEEYQIGGLKATLPGGIKVNNLPELEDYHVEYDSSNTNVVVVDNNGGLVPVGKGTATVTVKSGTATRTINLTVTNELRTESKLTLAEPTVKLSTSATEEYPVAVTILDQYGDPVPGVDLAAFIENLSPTGTDVVNSKQEQIGLVKYDETPTDENGVATITVENADTAKAGAGTLDLIRTGSSTVLAKLNVQTSDVATVTTRKLEKASDRTDKKFALTLGGANDKLVLNGYTSGGFFVKTETLDDASSSLPATGNFGLRTTNPKVVAVDGVGFDEVEAIGVGKASIEAVDENGSRVAVVNYTVEDFSTKVAGGTFHDLNITATNNAPFDLSKDIINKLILTSGKTYAYAVVDASGDYAASGDRVVIYVEDGTNVGYQASEDSIAGEIRVTSTVRDAANANQPVVFTQAANDGTESVLFGKDVSGAAGAFDEKDKGTVVLRIHNGVQPTAPSIASTTINVDIK